MSKHQKVTGFLLYLFSILLVGYFWTWLLERVDRFSNCQAHAGDLVNCYDSLWPAGYFERYQILYLLALLFPPLLIYLINKFFIKTSSLSYWIAMIICFYIGIGAFVYLWLYLNI